MVNTDSSISPVQDRTLRLGTYVRARNANFNRFTFILSRKHQLYHSYTHLYHKKITGTQTLKCTFDYYKILIRASRSNTGTDRMGKLILVRQTDSRQCFLTTQARRLSVNKVRKEKKTSFRKSSFAICKNVETKIDEIAQQKAKETCYNPSVLERAWELRTIILILKRRLYRNSEVTCLRITRV